MIVKKLSAIEAVIDLVRQIRSYLIDNTYGKSSFQHLVKILDGLLVELKSIMSKPETDLYVERLRSLLDVLIKVILIVSMLRH